jgi:DNA-binding transcriptional LysR family regulator
MSAILSRFCEEHPRISVRVIESDASRLRRELRERNIELVIGRFPKALSDEDLSLEVLFQEQQYIVAGVQNPLLRRSRITLADLVDEAWILPPPDSTAGLQIAEAFGASGVQVPRPSIMTLSVTLRIGLLATGRFLTVFPQSMLEATAMRPLFEVLPIALPAAPQPAGIITLKDRTMSALAHLFVQCTRTFAKRELDPGLRTGCNWIRSRVVATDGAEYDAKD